jgi:hypothetical protein
MIQKPSFCLDSEGGNSRGTDPIQPKTPINTPEKRKQARQETYLVVGGAFNLALE